VAVQRLLAEALAVVRRQWWIVAVVIIAALATGYATALRVVDTYTANAYVMHDTASSARYRGMPLMDDLVKEVSRSRVREAVASETGLTVDEVESNLRAAAAGNPLTHINIFFSADDEETAEIGAQTAAEEIIGLTNEAVAIEIAYRVAQIKASEQALEEMQGVVGETPIEQADWSYRRWSVETKLIDYQRSLTAVEDVYTYDGNMSTSLLTGASVFRRDIVGAGIAGLILGLLAAAVREALSRLRSTA